MQELVLAHLVVVLLGGCFVAGLRAITADGMIGHPLRLFVQRRFGDKWGKPVLLCTWCMASVWGSITYFSVFMALANYSNVIETYVATSFFVLGWPFCLCCISFVGGILWLCKETLDKQKEWLGKP